MYCGLKCNRAKYNLGIMMQRTQEKSRELEEGNLSQYLDWGIVEYRKGIYTKPQSIKGEQWEQIGMHGIEPYNVETIKEQENKGEQREIQIGKGG